MGTSARIPKITNCHIVYLSRYRPDITRKISFYSIIYLSATDIIYLFLTELKRLIVKVQLELMFRRRFLFYVAMICCLLYGWVYLTRDQSKSLQEKADKNTLSSIHDSSDQLEISDLIRLQPVQGFQLAPHNGLVEYLQPALCEVVPASLILYNRIFKTGSETLSFHFKLAAGMKNYRYIRRKSYACKTKG